MTGGDFAAQVHAALAAALAARTRWDEPPALVLLRTREGHVTAGDASIVPGETWAMHDRVPGALECLAAAVERMPRAELRVPFGAVPGLCGIAFRHEGWMAGRPGVPAAFRQDMMADARAHRIHTRPDRIEARLIHACTRGGSFFTVQRRGHEPEHHDQVSGSIPDSLLTIWRAIERAAR